VAAMITVFENIPDIFVEKYDAQFCQWGREYRKRGRKVAIAFDVLPGEALKLDQEGRFIWTGAWLTADVEQLNGRQAMVIRPASDWDKNLIEVHCWHLKRHMLQ
jgi:hypothetical protein